MFSNFPCSVGTHVHLLQYMGGGDLGTALSFDANEHADKSKRRLGWYARGRIVLLCVARGLAYLHGERVRTGSEDDDATLCASISLGTKLPAYACEIWQCSPCELSIAR